MGRTDYQVKVRGFRIELGEVETALEAHPAVARAVVMAREERLVAYLVARESTPSITELRSWLGSQLPDYMVPSAWVVLESLPLTPNGKVDRKALPASEVSRGSSGEDWVAPRTAVEEVLAGIWSELLGVDRVGVHDNFFDLGGHSLKATQLAARVRQGFGVELPLRRLFERPTVAGLAEAVEQLRGADRGRQAPPLSVVSRAREMDLPLSFSQQRVWVLDQLDLAGTAYNLAVAVRLSGMLDVEALRWALSGAVARHEALRTSFANVQGRPVQVIARELAVALPRVDLSGLQGAERAREARRVASSLARVRFDLSQGPLVQAVLVRLGAAEHVIGLALHHMVADGWSLGILVREVAALYVGTVLPPLPLQYGDFSSWQRSWLQGEALEEQLSYWREQLAGMPPVLAIATDHPRRVHRGSRAGRQGIVLGEELSRGLRALGRQVQATPFMTLLAGFATLLHRYTGQSDVAVGTPIANRGRVELESLIGFFANTLVLRCELVGEPGFGALLARVRGMALDAYAHQDLPFERLVEELQPERELGVNPLFQVMFQLQNVPLSRIELPGLELEPLEVERGAAMFDLTLALREEGQSFAGVIEYDADLFEPTTIARLGSHLETLLRSAVSTPDRQLSDLGLLSAAERHELEVEWSDRSRGGSSGRVHEAIEAQVRRRPQAEALRFEGESLSYGELDGQSNRLARRLVDLGVARGSRVGVCLKRSPELLVSLLAVWKAGGAYVPMDPSYPSDRLSYMQADAGLSLLLADAGTPVSLGDRVPVLRVDEESWDGSGAALGLLGSASDLAYVIYTSGSTGRPKGVEVTHGALLSFLESMREEPGLGEGDVLLAVTSLSFDIAGLELYLPLLVGARIELVSREVASDGARLRSVLEESDATALQATPSTWRMLIDAGWQGGADLKVLCGGEALPERLASDLQARSSSVWNLYGPTETTVWSALWRVAGPGVRIGRPIANTRAVLLDGHGRPVPLGVPGELCLGGQGVARGYHERPDLTAERFVPSPYGELDGEPGGRLYRTGDLAHFRGDGTLEYLGRTDHQVKVRGFRIELGEVETALEAHPEVARAVVMAREDRLVAYLVARESTPSITELRSWLGSQLPDYMVPSAWVVLESLPLTPNGKVDRKALPAPEGGRQVAAPFVAPRGAVEELISGIWSEVLGVERVGMHDNFFELGGHSLLATQAVSRLGEALEIEVPLRRMFEAPTVARLAEVLLLDSSNDLEQAARLVLDLFQLSDGEVEALLADKLDAGPAGQFEEVS